MASTYRSASQHPSVGDIEERQHGAPHHFAGIRRPASEKGLESGMQASSNAVVPQVMLAIANTSPTLSSSASAHNDGDGV